MAIPPRTAWSKADEMQIELLRNAGPQRRFALAASMSESVIAMSRAAIRARHPELDDTEVKLRWAAIHYGDDLAAKIRRYLEQRRG